MDTNTSSYGYARPGYGQRPPPQQQQQQPPSMNGGTGPAMSPGMRPAGLQTDSNQSRAARYEDEKRRIIESCFSKKDPEDGVLLESYITHVRVTEDAAYPSSPPPPESEAKNKKGRLILVAVRKSGRVRVHKARENPSGSFSIGKTWALDDLTSIQIYTGLQPRDDREAAQRQWAGDLGFTVSLGKEYYWHAPTSKEKDFFIASLLKIYKKYTGGKIPQLIGFLPHQMDQFGATQAQVQSQSQSQTSLPPPQPQQQNRTPSGSISQPNNLPFNTPPPQTMPSPNNRFSPASQQGRFDGPASRTDLRQIPRDSDPSHAPIPEPLRSPARFDRRKPSQENLRRPSDASSASGLLPPSGPIPAVPPMPRQGLRPSDPNLRGGMGLSNQPSQTSLNSSQRLPLKPQSSATSLDSREKQGFPARPVNGNNQQANVSSEFLPTRLSARNRSQSSLHSADRPTTAGSDMPPAPSPSKPPMPEISSLAERKKAFLGQPEPPSAESSKFVTPATTPAAERKDVAVPSESSSAQKTPTEKPVTAAKNSYFAAATSPPDPPAPKMEETKSIPPVVRQKSPEPPKPVETPRSPPEPEPPKPEPVKSPAEPTSLTQSPMTSEPAAMTEADKEMDSNALSLLKKKATAEKIRKAAFAVNAFKPRQGGGAARLQAMKKETEKGGEPNGITGVVPAPLLRGMSSDSVGSGRPTTPVTPSMKDPSVAASPQAQASAVPPRVHLERSATEDSVQSVQSQQSQQSNGSLKTPGQPEPITETITESVSPKPPPKSVKIQTQTPPRPPSPDKARSRSPQRRKRQRQEQEIAKYASSLGIDGRIFEGRGADFTDMLSEFGWNGKLDTKRGIVDLDTDVRREIGRAQATGWLGHIEQQEAKVAELAKAFDRAIDECEELDGLFTLYSHELETLASDIEYIEAQSQGLQVQTANQKLLQKELQSLLSTLRISQADLKDLQYGALGDPRGVASVEKSLSVLYKALITIDPNIRQNRKRREGQGTNADRGIGVYADAELGQMRAVREKKDEYGEQSNAFIRRFCQHMNSVFKSLEHNKEDEALRPGNDSALATQRTARQELWLYNGMMLFVREVNSYEWKTLIKSYEMNVRGSYQEQFRQAAMASRRDARKPTGEEEHALFTFQEKDKSDESLTSSAARKLTVKRGKTVKTTGLKPAFGSRGQDGKPDAYEVFQTTLEHQAKVISEEQNFMVMFFHLSSQINVDFTELIMSRPPEERRLPNLTNKIPFEPDKNISGTIQASIEAMYSFWLTDLQGQLEWVIKQDQLQGVGVLCAIEHVMTSYDDTNQEFITASLRTLHTRLTGMFHKFVDEQIKAIEETKVKLKKRKGIISFMRTFPVFSLAVESMVPANMVSNENLEIRFILNDAYNKVLRAMWESLTFIAKDDSAQGTTGHSTAPASGDPEDKEALNYHILLIENMNHYLEEVETHSNVVLEEWKDRASGDMLTHLTQYTDAVIRRPLGKWLDFVESTEAMMRTADSYHSVASKPSHSRSTCKKIIKAYDAAEVRKGIDTLKKRIEKHFGDVEDPTSMSKSLITRVLEECSIRYAVAHDRMKLIIDKVYDGSLEIDWRKEEVSAMFKR